MTHDGVNIGVHEAKNLLFYRQNVKISHAVHELSLERHHTKDVINCFLLQALHFWGNVGHNNVFPTDRNKLPEC